MNKVISWTAYIWLLSVEAIEELAESASNRFFQRHHCAVEVRKKKVNDSCRVVPPTAIH
jgi:hypothetical protein